MLGFNFNVQSHEMGCSSVAELLTSDSKVASSSPTSCKIFSFQIFFAPYMYLLFIIGGLCNNGIIRFQVGIPHSFTEKF